MVRKCLLQAALILGLLVATSHAQQPPSSTQFRSGIAYVQVDVSVLDPNRLPVRGLSAADFIVREDGRPQKVLSFSEVELPAAEKPAVRWMRDWRQTSCRTTRLPVAAGLDRP